MRQTVEKEVAIDLARYGVQIDGPLPKVFVNIEPTSANFRIKNVELRVLTSYQYKASDRSITVLVRASPKDLKTLDRKHVFATIDLRGRPKGKYSEPVKVTLPENIGLVKAIPDKVGVTLY
jgi:YbbR domain-containing protein